MTDKETHESGSSNPAVGAGVVSTLDRMAFKPVYHLYYGALFGLRYPGCEWLSRRVAAWERRHARRDAPMSKDAWESEYRKGDWRFLHEEKEAGRYDWLVERIHRQDGGPPSVLDVGCGEGVLLERLQLGGPHSYTGIDLSETAVAVGRQAHPEAEFVVSEAEDFNSNRSYDAVVFNEIVYYLRDPIGEVKRYLELVAAGGTLLLSVFETTRTRAVLRRLHVELDVAEDRTFSDERGTWRLLSLTARSSPGVKRA